MGDKKSDDGSIENLSVEIANADFLVHGASTQYPQANVPSSRYRMRRVHRSFLHGHPHHHTPRSIHPNRRQVPSGPLLDVVLNLASPIVTAFPTPSPPLPTAGLSGSSASTTAHVIGTQAPAEAPAKASNKPSCTPSPTKSLAPSASKSTSNVVNMDTYDGLSMDDLSVYRTRRKSES
jgi:hypothetical protein